MSKLDVSVDDDDVMQMKAELERTRCVPKLNMICVIVAECLLNDVHEVLASATGKIDNL